MGEMDWTAVNNPVIEKFRRGTDEDAHRFMGQPILLLTTKGAKSGKARVNPLVSLFDNNRLYVIASKGGSPDHPDWYHNVRANPEVRVELPNDRFTAEAVQVKDRRERDRLYAKIASEFPNFAEYERTTDRTIPVVELVRKG